MLPAPAAIQADDENQDTVVIDLTVNVVGKPVVYTICACGVGTRKATLRGFLVDLGTADEVRVYFGWDIVSHADDPAGYAYWTVPQVKTRMGFFTTRLECLAPGTTYYYRAVAAGDGTAYGEERIFRTQECHCHWPWHWWWGWWHWPCGC